LGVSSPPPGNPQKPTNNTTTHEGRTLAFASGFGRGRGKRRDLGQGWYDNKMEGFVYLAALLDI